MEHRQAAMLDILSNPCNHPKGKIFPILQKKNLQKKNLELRGANFPKVTEL